MNVSYTIQGEPHTLQAEGDGLPELMSDITGQLGQRHEVLAANPELLNLIADGLLNSLADDSDAVDIGELANA